MKIGDLVKDIDPSYTGQHGVGIIVDVDTDLVGVYKVTFPDGAEWLSYKYLELISEGRKFSEVDQP